MVMDDVAGLACATKAHTTRFPDSNLESASKYLLFVLLTSTMALVCRVLLISTFKHDSTKKHLQLRNKLCVSLGMKHVLDQGQ